MGKNKNNSSTQITKESSNKLGATTGNRVVKEKISKACEKRETRSSTKIPSTEGSCEGQPLPKQSKAGPPKRVARLNTVKIVGKKTATGSNKIVRNAKNDAALPGVVVASTKSLIDSIKTGVVGGRTNVIPSATLSPKGGRIKERILPSTSKKIDGRVDKKSTATQAVEQETDQNSDVPSECSEEDDNVKLDYSSDDYVDEQGSLSPSTEGEYSSSSDGSLDSQSSSDDEAPEQELPAQMDQSLQEEEPLDRNDPRVKKLLDQLMREEKEKGAVKGNGVAAKIAKKQVSSKKSGAIVGRVSKSKRPSRVKSPSDTTLYAPALLRGNAQFSPAAVSQRHIGTPPNRNGPNQITDQISSFIEKLRPERNDQRSQDRDGGRSRSRDRGNGKRKSDREVNTGSPRSGSRSRNVADNVVLQAERFKASIEPPKGTNDVFLPNVPCGDSLQDNVKELLTILKGGGSLNMDGNDDDFFHVTCHVDPAMKDKFAKGEFVDLERLLPKTRYQVMTGGVDNDIEVIRKNGSTYILPEGGQRDNKITNVRRWEQAFRVYSAIYSQANPDRAAEIWQYVHVINTAALSYAWENVAFYDVTFRQLMEKKPQRSWAKIYTQMWNLALTDKIKSNYSGAGSSTGQGPPAAKRYGDWRDRCCWRYNKGKCKNWKCRYEHRCSVKDCGSYSHPNFQCPKKKQQGGGNGATSSTAGTARPSESKI